MQPTTSEVHPVPAAEDGPKWGLDESVLTERTPGTGRVALWLPGGREGGYQRWERIGPFEQKGIVIAPGVRAAEAASIRARQRVGGLLSKLFHRSEGQSWALPNGQTAEQVGARRSDLLLVWGEDGTAPDEGWIRSRWPEADRAQPMGKNLTLVSGVKPSAERKEPSGKETPVIVDLPPEPAQQECGSLINEALRKAERTVAAAREVGDRGGELTALADLGSAHLHKGDAEKSIAVLGEALAVARELGDRSAESEILGNLGLVTLAAGHPERALEIFRMEHALAREAGDRFGEKLALERIGLAHTKLDQSAEALSAFEQALALAKKVGHRKHEADLLWYAAIEHTELGERERAIERGEAAIELMRAMRNPQATLFAEHLRKYRAGEPTDGLAISTAAGSARLPETYLGGSVEAGLWAQAPAQQSESLAGPGWLRMALSATKSMAKFVGSGFKLASPHILQQRLQTCAGCPHHTGLRCRLCGCFTSTKARLDHEECPIGKWPA